MRSFSVDVSTPWRSGQSKALIALAQLSEGFCERCQHEGVLIWRDGRTRVLRTRTKVLTSHDTGPSAAILPN